MSKAHQARQTGRPDRLAGINQAQVRQPYRVVSAHQPEFPSHLLAGSLGHGERLGTT